MFDTIGESALTQFEMIYKRAQLQSKTEISNRREAACTIPKCFNKSCMDDAICPLDIPEFPRIKTHPKTLNAQSSFSIELNKMKRKIVTK